MNRCLFHRAAAAVALMSPLLLTPAAAQPQQADDAGFVQFGGQRSAVPGAQGLLSLQGSRGLLVNPTSGTLGQGQATVQYGVVSADQTAPNSDVTAHMLLGSYGVTDWLELGVTHSSFEVRDLGEIQSVTGPTARVRVLEEDHWRPEVSVGGVYFDGDSTSDVFSRQEVYLAASKRFAFGEPGDGLVDAFRLHGGLRQIWRSDAPAAVIDTRGLVGYVGGELHLPYDVSLIAEVNTQEDVLGPRTPWGYGVQWKPGGGVIGLSGGQVQSGSFSRPANYIGIAASWSF